MFKFIQTNFSSATVPQQIDKTRKSLNGKNCKLKLEGKKKSLKSVYDSRIERVHLWSSTQPTVSNFSLRLVARWDKTRAA